MLTLSTIIKATRQMGSDGEPKQGAIDHLVSRLMGFRGMRRKETLDTAGSSPDVVRRWDESKGAYIFVKK